MSAPGYTIMWHIILPVERTICWTKENWANGRVGRSKTPAYFGTPGMNSTAHAHWDQQLSDGNISAQSLENCTVILLVLRPNIIHLGYPFHVTPVS